MPSLKINEQGILTIDGNKIFNSVVESYTIDGGVIMSESNIENQSGKTKSFDGYDDTSITINITLYNKHDEKGSVSVSRYDAMAVINSAFKKIDGKEPMVYNFDFPLAKSMNIKKGIIKHISVSVGKATSTLDCSIELVEFEPDVTPVQAQKKMLSDTLTHASEIIKQTTTHIQEVMTDENDKKLFVGLQQQGNFNFSTMEVPS